MTYEEFLKDIKTQDVVVRNLEIMGEVTKNLSEGLRGKYSDLINSSQVDEICFCVCYIPGYVSFYLGYLKKILNTLTRSH
jgi:hypothetical protein